MAIKLLRFITTLLLYQALTVSAATQEYIRDYQYTATRYDSEYTSRIRAIDGVKQSLLDELGVYVASVIKINKDQFGNSVMSQDVQTLTAGIISLIVLNEDWNLVRYYLKAKMKADPDEVLKAVKELQKNEELEQALRDSMRELQQARAEIAALKQQLLSASNITQDPADNSLTQASVSKTPVQQPVETTKKPSKPNTENVAKEQPSQAVKKPEAESWLFSQYQAAVENLEAESVFQLAMRAYIFEDYPEMLRLMKSLADKGYARAQSKLGWIYERGLGIKPDPEQALQLYHQAKDKDDGFAYARLGFMYQRGIGVERDYQKSVAYLEKSIEKGNGHGHALMGYAHFVRAGVARDYDLAHKHARLAAEKGSAWGYAWLGRTYEFGLGVDVDYEKAYEMYSKAIKHGNPLGLGLYGHMYLKGRYVDKDEEKGFKYIKAGADRGNPLAKAMLGILYETGTGTDEDEIKAFELFQQSADERNTLGMMRLARCYWEGIGVDEDKAKAKKIVLEVIKKGMPKAQKVFMRMTRSDSWGWYEFFFDESWNPS